jgi:aldehyde dehydrogenase (NAD+)
MKQGLTMDITQLYHAQHAFFQTNETKSLSFRLLQLNKLEHLILSNQTALVSALRQDLNKSPTEAQLTEFNIVLEEIKFAKTHLASWMAPKKVNTPFPALWRGKSRVQRQAYGVALIIAPWNFPVQLSLAPLVGAIAGGNCAVIKPSPLAKHTHDLLIKLINEAFPAHYIQAVALTDAECDTLLACPWQVAFFTGSTRVGKHVLTQLAAHLTPTTLELGGKSPCIIDETADIAKAAKHIVWAKFLNAGQVCIAPDFILVHHKMAATLQAALIEAIKHYFGENPKTSADYGRIINDAHYQRLLHLLEHASVAHGGRHDDQTRYIEPTLLDHVRWSDPIMQDEIFGPLLPILMYENNSDIITPLLQKPSPLAFYVFSKNRAFIKTLMQSLPFGSAAINTCLLQYTNLNLPFGGVGQSGMGRYHGKYSFDTFTYQQSCYERYRFPDITLHHPPYTQRKTKWLQRLLGL